MNLAAPPRNPTISIVGGVKERPKTIPRHHNEYGELKSVTYLPDDDAALDYALSMAHQSREKSNRKVGA